MTRKLTSCIAAPWRVSRPRSPADLSNADRFSPASFSILFAEARDRPGRESQQPPEFFDDLNCDQIIDAITAHRADYNLKPFFYQCLRRVDAVIYRHEVMQDLENVSFRQQIDNFAEQMREVREHLRRRDKAYYLEQKQSWFADAVDIYCNAVQDLLTALRTIDVKSRGFLALHNYLEDYTGSADFSSLRAEVTHLKAALRQIEYCILVKGTGFTVGGYEGEPDYSADVENTFAKFKQGTVKDYKVKFSSNVDMNYVEAKIVEFVRQLHPDVFSALRVFCDQRAGFLDDVIVSFDREVQFYAAYLGYCGALKRAGLPFCYPVLSDISKEVYDRDAFDIALAHKLVRNNAAVVCNDFRLQGDERALIVSGPNQGGKTTFARMFGQVHYLASIGCPVPGREAQLLLFDQLFTHFEKEEKVENLRGKLEDDLIRARAILDRATARSIIVMNEIFTSTTIQDETLLSKKIIAKLVELGALCVWVTFVDELASIGPHTVSMTSTVVPDNPAMRTFKVVRRPADGLAYAMAIAQKYRLTYEAIRDRVLR